MANSVDPDRTPRSDQDLHCLLRHVCMLRINESRQVKMYLRPYADSKGPDQPARPRSLSWALSVRYQNHWTL